MTGLCEVCTEEAELRRTWDNGWVCHDCWSDLGYEADND